MWILILVYPSCLLLLVYLKGVRCICQGVLCIVYTLPLVAFAFDAFVFSIPFSHADVVDGLLVICSPHLSVQLLVYLCIKHIIVRRFHLCKTIISPTLHNGMTNLLRCWNLFYSLGFALLLIIFFFKVHYNCCPHNKYFIKILLVDYMNNKSSRFMFFFSI